MHSRPVGTHCCKMFMKKAQHGRVWLMRTRENPSILQRNAIPLASGTVLDFDCFGLGTNLPHGQLIPSVPALDFLYLGGSWSWPLQEGAGEPDSGFHTLSYCHDGGDLWFQVHSLIRRHLHSSCSELLWEQLLCVFPPNWWKTHLWHSFGLRVQTWDSGAGGSRLTPVPDLVYLTLGTALYLILLPICKLRKMQPSFSFFLSALLM